MSSAGLSVPHMNPDGVRMMLPSDHLDIARRINEGDATCLWSGDDRMYVCWNAKAKKYEVWRLGEDNVDRILSTWKPAEFDARVLKHLAEHDTRVHDVLARIDAENASLERQRENEAAEALKAGLEFATWASKKLYLPGHDAPMPSPSRGN